MQREFELIKYRTEVLKLAKFEIQDVIDDHNELLKDKGARY